MLYWWSWKLRSSEQPPEVGLLPVAVVEDGAEPPDASSRWEIRLADDRRRCRIPLAIPAGATRVEIETRELRLLLEGVDPSVLRAARRSARAS